MTDDRPTPDFTMRQLQALLGAQPAVDDPDARTITEMAAAWGLDRHTVLELVRARLAEGKIVAVPVKRVSGDGRAYPVTGYKPNPNYQGGKDNVQES